MKDAFEKWFKRAFFLGWKDRNRDHRYTADVIKSAFNAGWRAAKKDNVEE